MSVPRGSQICRRHLSPKASIETSNALVAETASQLVHTKSCLFTMFGTGLRRGLGINLSGFFISANVDLK